MDTRARVANLKALSGVPRNLNQIATGNCGRRLVSDIQPNLVGYLSFNIYGEGCYNVGTTSKYKYTKIPEITDIIACNTWILQERERGREKKNKKHETSRISYTVFVDTSINLHRFSNLPETLSHLSLPTLGRAVKSTSMPQRFSTGEKRRVIFKWKSVAEKTKKISYVWRSLWLGENGTGTGGYRPSPNGRPSTQHIKSSNASIYFFSWTTWSRERWRFHPPLAIGKRSVLGHPTHVIQVHAIELHRSGRTLQQKRLRYRIPNAAATSQIQHIRIRIRIPKV